MHTAPLSLKCTKCITLSLLLFLWLLSPPSVSGSQDKIIIGLIPEMNVFKQMERFKPLADYLSQKLQINVKLTMLSRYGNIIKRLQDDKIDAAFLGSFTGALSIMQLGVVPLARPVNLDGSSTYFGYIFVRKDSGIKTVADMRNKSIAFVEQATTAGYVFPLAYLKRNGVSDFTSYFKDYYFTGSHDSAIDAVLNADADIGAAKNTIYEFLSNTTPRINNELLILATSPKVPSNGLCVRADMDESIKEKLRDLLLNLHKDPQSSHVLKKLRAFRFVETKKEDYQPVIDLAEDAGIRLDKYSYMNQ